MKHRKPTAEEAGQISLFASRVSAIEPVTVGAPIPWPVTVIEPVVIEPIPLVSVEVSVALPTVGSWVEPDDGTESASGVTSAEEVETAQEPGWAPAALVDGTEVDYEAVDRTEAGAEAVGGGSGGTLLAGQRDSGMSPSNLPAADTAIASTASTATLTGGTSSLIKWMGGKVAAAHEITSWFADRAGDCPVVWVEPFFGAGSVFFSARRHLDIAASLLSDASEPVISFWRGVQEDPEGVWVEYETLRVRQIEEPEKVYYEVRDAYQQTPTPGRFLFLNKTCFNGLWRVNAKGMFNASFGKRLAPALSRDTVYSFSGRLDFSPLVASPWAPVSRASLRPEAFGVPGGLTCIYLDPPYLGTFDGHVADSLDHARLAAWAAEVGQDPQIIVAISGDDPEIYRSSGLIPHPIGTYFRRCAPNAGGRVHITEYLWTTPHVDR